MDSKLAKTQKENKREDAPICIPCILGIKRKPIEQAIADTKLKFGGEKGIESFKNYLKKYRK
jgi:hypothetical protein